MEKGIEYASSRRKRFFDLAVATGLMPVKLTAKGITGLYLSASGVDHTSAEFFQERIGQNEQPFMIRKVLTLHPESGVPLSKFSGLLRKLGLDETAQASNIIDGTMSAAGYRPLIPEEFEASMDSMTRYNQKRWSQVIKHTKPGGISSYALYAHQATMNDPNTPDMRAEMDYQDFITDGSLKHDINLFVNLAKVALERRLQ